MGLNTYEYYKTILIGDRSILVVFINNKYFYNINIFIVEDWNFILF